MRRYTLGVGDRQFVIDVQEIAADRFEVLVGNEAYEVTLSGDENLAEASITPALLPGSQATPRPASALGTVARVRHEPPPSQRPAMAPAPRQSTGRADSQAALTAPMPGVILEVNVKAGDTVTRGQQVAILDAMKMHNVIGAPRAGTIAEVFVSAGQSVNHGDAIISFAGD